MLDTQELAPVAIALLLSVIGGIGTFLMDVRDGRSLAICWDWLRRSLLQ